MAKSGNDRASCTIGPGCRFAPSGLRPALVPCRQDCGEGWIVLLTKLVDAAPAPLIRAFEPLEGAVEIKQRSAREFRHRQYEIERADRQPIRILVQHQAALQHPD